MFQGPEAGNSVLSIAKHRWIARAATSADSAADSLSAPPDAMECVAISKEVVRRSNPRLRWEEVQLHSVTALATAQPSVADAIEGIERFHVSKVLDIGLPRATLYDALAEAMTIAIARCRRWESEETGRRARDSLALVRHVIRADEIRGQRLDGTAAGSQLGSLTRREHEVLELLLKANRVTWIARRLGISQSTVRNHIKRIFDKTGIRSQGALIGAFRQLD